MILTRARTGAVNLAVKGVNASERREEDARQALAGKPGKLVVIPRPRGIRVESRFGSRTILHCLVGEGTDVTRVIAVDRIRSMRDNGGACTHEYGHVPSVVAL